MEVAEFLREILTEKPISHILATGLHDYLDVVQIQLQRLAASIGRAFFRDWRPEEGASPGIKLTSGSQSQSQSSGVSATSGPELKSGGRTEALA
jgi:hypothetical protein